MSQFDSISYPRNVSPFVLPVLVFTCIAASSRNHAINWPNEDLPQLLFRCHVSDAPELRDAWVHQRTPVSIVASEAIFVAEYS